jgi:hypothetical protein
LSNTRPIYRRRRKKGGKEGGGSCEQNLVPVTSGRAFLAQKELYKIAAMSSLAQSQSMAHVSYLRAQTQMGHSANDFAATLAAQHLMFDGLKNA